MTWKELLAELIYIIYIYVYSGCTLFLCHTSSGHGKQPQAWINIFGVHIHRAALIFSLDSLNLALQIISNNSQVNITLRINKQEQCYIIDGKFFLGAVFKDLTAVIRGVRIIHLNSFAWEKQRRQSHSVAQTLYSPEIVWIPICLNSTNTV